jgi:CheY-like chemotaxis protein
MKILVVEDGHEYSELLTRFLGEQFCFQRAGDGFQALELLQQESWALMFLDVCFDRIPVERLIGDLNVVSERFNGCQERGVQHLQAQQGIYILAEVRKHQFALPVLLSKDFIHDMSRWNRLSERYGPIRFLSDNAGPAEMSQCFLEMGRAS